MAYRTAGRRGADVNSPWRAVKGEGLKMPTAFRAMPGDRPGPVAPEPYASAPRHEPKFWPKKPRKHIIGFRVRR
jgi:hypothetical protein